MFSKVNVWQIVKDHFDTLRDFATKKIAAGDIILFFVVPFAISCLLLFAAGILLDQSTSNVLITSLSIFSALLFNLLVLIYDIVRKEEKEQKAMGNMSLIAQFLKEIYSNISYLIFISVVCVSALLIAFFDIKLPYFRHALSFIVYFLVSQFMLTMFMVLKRIHVLLSMQFKQRIKPLTKKKG